MIDKQIFRKTHVCEQVSYNSLYLCKNYQPGLGGDTKYDIENKKKSYNTLKKACMQKKLNSHDLLLRAYSDVT